jgi:hypothetical protein
LLSNGWINTFPHNLVPVAMQYKRRVTAIYTTTGVISSFRESNPTLYIFSHVKNVSAYSLVINHTDKLHAGFDSFA